MPAYLEETWWRTWDLYHTGPFRHCWNPQGQCESSGGISRIRLWKQPHMQLAAISSRHFLNIFFFKRYDGIDKVMRNCTTGRLSCSCWNVKCQLEAKDWAILRTKKFANISHINNWEPWPRSSSSMSQAESRAGWLVHFKYWTRPFQRADQSVLARFWNSSHGSVIFCNSWTFLAQRNRMHHQVPLIVLVEKLP